MLQPKMRKVQDSSLIKKMPASSKFITTAEWKELYPDGIRRSKDFIFDPGMPQEIPEKEAFLLINKYPELKIVNDKYEQIDTADDLDEIKFRELQILGGRYGVDLFKKSKDFIKAGIREKRNAGAVPITEEEYHERKANKTVLKNRD